MEHEPMPTQRVLTNHRSHPLRQPVEPAAHVHGLTRQPDPRFLRAVHRLQTRQPDHDVASTTASNARTCSASNPRPTSRLRPFDRRISTRSEEHTSELQSRGHLVCRLLLEKKKM